MDLTTNEDTNFGDCERPANLEEMGEGDEYNPNTMYKILQELI